MMRDPKKKCIAKKCEDCQFYQNWNVEEVKDGKPTGIRGFEEKCSMQVLIDEVPRIRGAIDGCQTASNETRNSVIEFGAKAVKTITAAFQTPIVLDHQKKIEE